MPEIELEIDEDGEIVADYKGFHGMACKAEEKKLFAILKALRIKKTGEVVKAEAQHETEKRMR